MEQTSREKFGSRAQGKAIVIHNILKSVRMEHVIHGFVETKIFHSHPIGLSVKAQKGDPAFVMDVVKALRLRGESSVTRTLNRMQRNGFITLKGGGRGRSRVVCLTSRGRLEAALGGVPLLGSIPAGPLEEAIAQAETVLDEGELLPCRPGDFALRVKGDSMVGDGIFEGDKVLLRPDVTVENGEIAAVLIGIDYEATLKRVFFSTTSRKVILRASNPRYPDSHVSANDVKIAGVFRGLVREHSRPRSR